MSLKCNIIKIMYLDFIGKHVCSNAHAPKFLFDFTIIRAIISGNIFRVKGKSCPSKKNRASSAKMISQMMQIIFFNIQ